MTIMPRTISNVSRFSEYRRTMIIFVIVVAVLLFAVLAMLGVPMAAAFNFVKLLAGMAFLIFLMTLLWKF